ncbi:uncharacterized protein ACRADG_002684 [Cochliomyia hominivorax]
MEVKPAQIAATAFMVGYIFFAVTGSYLVYDRINCDSKHYFIKHFENFSSPHSGKPNNDLFGKYGFVSMENVEEPQASFQDRYCAAGLHGFFSTVALFVLGLAVVIYRLLNGVKTRRVKHIHVCLHLLSVILFAISYYYVYFVEYYVAYDRYNFHKYTSLFACAMYLIQYILGWIIFLFQSNIELRLTFAPYHDVFGVWLLVCLVACCLSGKRFANSDYTSENQINFVCLTFISFSLILVIVINPYFEWDLVGHI